MSSTEDQLAELAFLQGDHTELRKRLAKRGYKPNLQLKGPHDAIKWNCEKGGRGIMCQHTWIATPMEALTEEGGCPWCKLESHIKDDPPEEVSQEVLIKAIKKQHKALSDMINRGKRRHNWGGNNYGMDRYTI